MDDELTDLLRRTLATRALDVDEGPDAPGGPASPSGRVGAAPRVRAATWSVAAALALLAASTAVVRAGDRSSPIDPGSGPAPVDSGSPTQPTAPVGFVPTVTVPDSAGVTTPAATSADTSTSASPPVVPTTPAAFDIWVMPTWLPDGMALLDLRSGQHPLLAGDQRGSTRQIWVRHGPDGNITASIVVDTTATDRDVNSDPNTTLRGRPALLQADEGGQQVFASWWEQGEAIVVQATGLTRTDLGQVIEGATIDAGGTAIVFDPTTVAGFERVRPAHGDWGPVRSASTAVAGDVASVGSSRWLSATVTPARSDETLDNTQRLEGRRTIVDGTVRAITRSFVGGMPLVNATWFDRSVRFAVEMRLDADDATIDRIVGGVQLVDRAAARAALDRTAAFANTLAVVSTARTDDGATLTAYGGGRAPVLVCVSRAASSRCVGPRDGSTDFGAGFGENTNLVEVGGVASIVGWSATTPSSIVDASGSPITAIAADHGWFVYRRLGGNGTGGVQPFDTQP